MDTAVGGSKRDEGSEEPVDLSYAAEALVMLFKEDYAYANIGEDARAVCSKRQGV
jgi:hypothetical protein